MRVAVLGGGLQGCCVALSLAEKGMHVTLFDRNGSLLSRAAVANEGKIHLGYMYANDPSVSTARMMMKGALAFAPFFARHLGQKAEQMTVSRPAVYLVHQDSHRSPEEIASYFSDVHNAIKEAAFARPAAYFGIDVTAPPRRWSSVEFEGEFSTEATRAAFDTPEVAIDPVQLARDVRRCIAATPRIEVRLRRTVQSVQADDERLRVHSDGDEGAGQEHFDHVVNALWDGRIAIDDDYGLKADRQWLHRLKYGVSFRRPIENDLRSATVISGPFGEVVSYPDGLTYLTWYPTCQHGISSDVSPPDWPTYPEDPLQSLLPGETLAALSKIVLSLRHVQLAQVSDLVVKGGVIVAWGETDIYDPLSGLHRRYEIGVRSSGRFHSIDPGKLTMAPFFAEQCAERIASN